MWVGGLVGHARRTHLPHRSGNHCHAPDQQPGPAHHSPATSPGNVLRRTAPAPLILRKPPSHGGAVEGRSQLEGAVEIQAPLEAAPSPPHAGGKQQAMKMEEDLLGIEVAELEQTILWHPKMSDPITLNVGGKIYTTSLSTLTSYPDSMLGAMFSGKMPTKKDSQGNCFIDRDGKVFRYILNFLRTSHLDLPEDFQEMGLLKREADFYQVQPLMEALLEKEVELSKAEKNAMLNISLEQKKQTVHFTVREAPQIYSLSSSNMEVFSANIFSTSCLFLKLLGSKLYYYFNGNLSSVTSYLDDPNHLTLGWVANVDGLPEEEYTRQDLKRLWVIPTGKQINSFQVFVEEVLKIAMSDGFCVDSSHPHSSDFMNNKIIRLLRYR
ncbi:hypothetical protein NDU88_002547 [Pleurodeles waltl]|uniref:BTB/POZ domain-containing protein KCTD15 n=2 Tax=Pleurodeles waltl TaxID=8319 RepID=A0AAV7RAK5_PLEWA|nr:hypothetical protein NDU88_002547 [Pleurodeles waltl]